MSSDIVQPVVQLVVGAAAPVVFILALFIGFCVAIGFTKTKRTAGSGPVVKSLDEVVSRNAVSYLSPSDPHGPADQLRAPELVEASARK